MELTPANLDLMLKAAPVCTYEPQLPEKVEQERPELEEPNVKWMRMGKHDVLYCRYYDACASI